MIDAAWFAFLQQWLHEHLAQPLLFSLGLGNFVEDAYEACGWLLLGLLQMGVLLLVLVPLERWRPVERWADRRAVRVDILYTAIHRLGLFQLGWFFLVQPFWDAWSGWLAVHGVVGWQLDSWLAPLRPGFTDQAWVVFVAYLVVLDFFDYWIHRGQHRWRWWWSLHALHHSQRQMTCFSDSRNHLLDDLLRDLILVQVSQCIGVAPGQFVLLVAARQLLENLSHANLRLSLPRWMSGLVVTPGFHRLHHGIEWVPGERAVTAGGCNFAVLLPLWDHLFGTASPARSLGPTGIADQLPEGGGRDYGRGFWAQQVLGVRRLLGGA